MSASTSNRDAASRSPAEPHGAVCLLQPGSTAHRFQLGDRLRRNWKPAATLDHKPRMSLELLPPLPYPDS
jgi:hypothetical protein